MKFSVRPPYGFPVVSDPEWIAAFARQAEACGFESIGVPEHAAVPATFASKYPYTPDGSMPIAVDAPMPDPLETLAYLAGCTSSIKLFSALLIVPLHHPVMLAKRLATLDRVSNGRLMAGLGVGWLKEELEVFGADPSTRGARTDESIEIMQRLWRDGIASYHGRFFEFDEVCIAPSPARPDGVPIHIGGHGPAAARRAGRYGAGIMPNAQGEVLVALIAAMRAAAADAGRVDVELDVTVSAPLDVVDAEMVERLGASGVTRIMVGTRVPDLDDACAALGEFAEVHRLVSGE